MNYNILYQVYLTPEKPFIQIQSELCFRCDHKVGTFLHSTGVCMKAKPFWRDICTILTEIIKINFPLDPELCLLGNFLSTHGSLKKHTTDIFENSFSAWPGNALQ